VSERRKLSVIGPDRPWATRADGASRRLLPVLAPVREVDRAARPVYAVWEITLRCDLACLHCGSRAGKGRPDELSTAEALDAVDQIAALGVREVSLIGGEVYLREDWEQIARRVKDRGMACGIVTGGRGFTRERARAARDAGVDGVSVSVDGLEATHDRLRAVHGSHGAAMEALGHLAAVGLKRSANTQINRWNLREIPAVLESLLPTGIFAWQVQFTVAMARAADHPSMLLEPYQLLEAMPMIARLKQRADEAKVRIWSGNNVGYFGPFEKLLYETSQTGHHLSCGAGTSALGIEANGDVKGCPSLPTADYVGGNLRDRSLLEIWEQTAQLRFTRDRTPDELWGFCKTCYYAEDCMAGCSWTSHVLLGKRGNNPYCHHRTLELLKEGKRERIEQIEAAPGHPFDHGLFAILLEDWPAEERARAERIVRGEDLWLDDRSPAILPR
jgi:radical SAM protein with 4Fe4S-binding SPASM domain